MVCLAAHLTDSVVVAVVVVMVAVVVVAVVVVVVVAAVVVVVVAVVVVVVAVVVVVRNVVLYPISVTSIRPQFGEFAFAENPALTVAITDHLRSKGTGYSVLNCLTNGTLEKPSQSSSNQRIRA